MPRVVNKLLPGTLISQQRARHFAYAYSKALVEHVMLIRRCATRYTEQLVDGVMEMRRTRRAARLLHIEEFKSRLFKSIPLKGKIYINVRSCLSGNMLEVTLGEKWPISWSQVYQSVRAALEVSRVTSMCLWFENEESLYQRSDYILSLSSSYITKDELKRTLIYWLKPNTETEAFQ